MLTPIPAQELITAGQQIDKTIRGTLVVFGDVLPKLKNVEAGAVGEAIGHQDNLRSCKARPSRLRSSAS